MCWYQMCQSVLQYFMQDKMIKIPFVLFKDIPERKILVVYFEKVPNVTPLVQISDSDYLQYCLFESDSFVEYEEYFNIKKTEI